MTGDRPSAIPQETERHESLAEAVGRLLAITSMEKADKARLEIFRQFGIDGEDLELARRWVWIEMSDRYDAKTILELYQLIQGNQDFPWLGPTAFRFCKDNAEIRRQIDLTRTMIGTNAEAFVRGERIPFGRIDDYDVSLHGHDDTANGMGLVCLSIARAGQAMFRVSSYPADPIVAYEIQGFSPEEGQPERIVKRATHRFTAKYGCAPYTALLIEVMRVAAENERGFSVLTGAHTWRNFLLVGEKLERADKQYARACVELGLALPRRDQAVWDALHAMQRMIREEQPQSFDWTEEQEDRLEAVLRPYHEQVKDEWSWTEFTGRLYLSRTARRFASVQASFSFRLYRGIVPTDEMVEYAIPEMAVIPAQELSERLRQLESRYPLLFAEHKRM